MTYLALLVALLIAVVVLLVLALAWLAGEDGDLEPLEGDPIDGQHWP